MAYLIKDPAILMAVERVKELVEEQGTIRIRPSTIWVFRRAVELLVECLERDERS